MMGSGHRGSRMGKEWLSFPHQPAEGNKHSTHSMSLKFLRKVKGTAVLGNKSGWPLLVADSHLSFRNHLAMVLQFQTLISTLNSGSHLTSVLLRRQGSSVEVGLLRKGAWCLETKKLEKWKR